MVRKIAFTPSSFDGLSNGAIKDPITPGLSLEVLNSGKKVWRYYRRVAGSGELIRLRLGFYPTLSIAEARKEASRLNKNVETGEDPREAINKSAARAE
ncbi:MAG: DUF4102 domain-containing protein [Novosphingobium sp.]|nr:DUF4102 domain-containing protein [Novosphingobium sp.]